ncbi:hypothetical protein KUCAC02_017224 [Chaenocephalus aceratus]|uniref:Uncharacterized protein n=1 Tax=Chaenocephalus aceratus TaxID=36190 RepID=A0ACB9W1Y2_CHAAC|nr:hypothetical protein KUCAC02_017224 [Chaenocephalus aceratus]
MRPTRRGGPVHWRHWCVRPEQERRRRLKERNRRRFETKMLTAMGEVVSQLKSIGSQQERIIELLQDKP